MYQELEKLLSKILRHILWFKHNIIFVVVGTVLLILTIHSLWYSVLVVLYFIFLLKHMKKVFIALACFMLIIGMRIMFYHKELPVKDSYDLRITQVHEYDTYSKVTGKTKGRKILFYTDKAVKIGDNIQATGVITYPANNTFPSQFNEKRYYMANNITAKLDVSQLIITNHHFHMNQIPDALKAYFKTKTNHITPYVVTFILGDTSLFEEDLLDDISFLGLSHLLAVSGLHIGLFVFFVMKIISYTTLKESLQTILLFICLGIYLFLTSFSPSVLRASGMVVIVHLNKVKQWDLSVLDCISIIALGLLVIHPYYVYDLGFVLSFSITYSILLSRHILRNHSKIKQLYYLSAIAYLMSIPIIESIQTTINPLAIIINPLYVLYMSTILLPISYIVSVIPILDQIVYPLFLLFETTISFLANIDTFSIELGLFHPVFIMTYYGILIMILATFHQPKKQKQWIVIAVLFILCIKIIPFINPVKQLHFFDVKGDSTVIIDSFQRCVILIDTGEKDSFDAVIKALKQKRVQTIDLVILTHNHSDHIGEFNDIKQQFNIKEVLTSNQMKTNQQRFLCGSIQGVIYKHSGYANKNNNSLITYIHYMNQSWLFMGDAEYDRESHFLSRFNTQVDNLKVGHHGSITSSSKQLLQTLQPKHCYIMAHRDNSHNHPSNIIVSRLGNYCDVKQTKTFGTISLFQFQKRIFKKTYPPY